MRCSKGTIPRNPVDLATYHVIKRGSAERVAQELGEPLVRVPQFCPPAAPSL